MINSRLFIKSIILEPQDGEVLNQYPFNLPVIKNIKTIDIKSPVTFFIGENGSGKSTMLEAIAIAYGFNPEGGSKNFNFATRNSHSILSEYLRLSRGITLAKDGYFLRAESFYNVATQVEDIGIIDSYGGQSLHSMSHGESFLALANNRLFGNGLYILDEPEAALSPTGQFALFNKIHELVVRKNSQFIIVTHSPILMAYPAADILEFSENGITSIQYEETDHYLLYKSFLCNRRLLNDILKLD